MCVCGRVCNCGQFGVTVCTCAIVCQRAMKPLLSLVDGDLAWAGQAGEGSLGTHDARQGSGAYPFGNQLQRQPHSLPLTGRC